MKTDQHDTAMGLARKLCLGLVIIAGFAVQAPVWAQNFSQATHTAELAATARKQANFQDENASLQARQAANWVLDSGDNLGMPFMIIDKVQARVFMFDSQGQLSGAASALLGLAVGDDSVPGIGTRKLSSIRPEERTTPAGRFIASLGRNLGGKEILWIDYETAISLHRVVPGSKTERRAERLASPHAHDKRISYGCINVPVAFFEEVVMPAFAASNGVVYTLPETRPNQAVFTAYYEHPAE